MKEESKKYLKILSKILEVFAIVGKVFSIIAIPFLVICMFFAPVIINNVDVKDNKIIVNGFDEKIEIFKEGKNDATIKIKSGDKVVAEEKEEKIIDELKKMVVNTPKNKVIFIAEGYLTLAIALIVLGIIILNYTIKLFRNIRTIDTPFVEENVSYLRKIAKFMIIMLAVNIIGTVIIEAATNYEINIDMATTNIFYILLIFIASYIFEYGIELQKNSKKKLYDSKDE